jgi:hypothetical protein
MQQKTHRPVQFEITDQTPTPIRVNLPWSKRVGPIVPSARAVIQSDEVMTTDVLVTRGFFVNRFDLPTPAPMPLILDAQSAEGSMNSVVRMVAVKAVVPEAEAALHAKTEYKTKAQAARLKRQISRCMFIPV